MRLLPWITLVVAVVIAISPFGQEVYHGAFVSGETLARDIAQFVLMMVIAIIVGLALLEWLIRWLVARRRAVKTGSSAAVAADSRTES